MYFICNTLQVGHKVSFIFVGYKECITNVIQLRMALKSNTSSLNRRKLRDRDEEKEKKITTTSSASNLTSGNSPTTMRLPPKPKAELAIWIKDLNDLTPKNITPAKLMRGLIEMRNDIDTNKLLDAINRVT